jgi:hypothetical protein
MITLIFIGIVFLLFIVSGTLLPSFLGNGSRPMGIAHSVSGSVQKTPGMEPSETPTAAAGDDSPKEIIANRPFTSEPDADPGVVSQTGRKVITGAQRGARVK